jgi:hypothetical protein
MRRTALIVLLLLGLGILAAVIVLARRSSRAVHEPEPAAPPAEEAASPEGGAAPAAVHRLDDLPQAPDLPGDEPEQPTAAAPDPVESDLRSDLAAQLRAELESLPRQPLFERASELGVPTSRAFLMSREELIDVIAAAETGSHSQSGSSS